MKTIRVIILLLFLSVLLWVSYCIITLPDLSGLGNKTRAPSISVLDDDRKIGVKSLAIKVSQKPKLFLSLIYSLSYILFLISFIFIKADFFLNFILSIPIMVHFFFQIKRFDVNNPDLLNKIFISNTHLGGLIFLILIGVKYVSH